MPPLSHFRVEGDKYYDVPRRPVTLCSTTPQEERMHPIVDMTKHLCRGRAAHLIISVLFLHSTWEDRPRRHLSRQRLKRYCLAARSQCVNNVAHLD
jgi:hypothetical protein